MGTAALRRLVLPGRTAFSTQVPLPSQARRLDAAGEELAAPLAAAGPSAEIASGGNDSDQDDHVHVSELPCLAVRLLGPRRVVPELWPPNAAAMVFKLQTIAICVLCLIAFGTVVVSVSFAHGYEAWRSSSDEKCSVPLRWFLLGHLVILATGFVGPLSCLAFVCLGTWIGWGFWLFSHYHVESCSASLVQAAREALVSEIVIFVMVITFTVLAAKAMRLSNLALLTCEGYGDPWEPEAHLRFEELSHLVNDVEMPCATEDQEEVGEEQGISGERDCAICCAPLVGLNEVLATAVCGHRFHKDCILSWLSNNRTCPLCRHRVDRPMRSRGRRGQRIRTPAE